MIGDGATRVLCAVIQLAACQPTVTVRDVRDATGIKSTATVWKYLLRLRREGLVTWQPGRSGTLRPLVRVSLLAGAR